MPPAPLERALEAGDRAPGGEAESRPPLSPAYRRLGDRRSLGRADGRRQAPVSVKLDAAGTRSRAGPGETGEARARRGLRDQVHHGSLRIPLGAGPRTDDPVAPDCARARTGERDAQRLGGAHEREAVLEAGRDRRGAADPLDRGRFLAAGERAAGIRTGVVAVAELAVL